MKALVLLKCFEVTSLFHNLYFNDQFPSTLCPVFVVVLAIQHDSASPVRRHILIVSVQPASLLLHDTADLDYLIFTRALT